VQSRNDRPLVSGRCGGGLDVARVAPLAYASPVTSLPVFSPKVEQWLDALASSRRGGALLITPAGDIGLVRGDVTPEGAQVALANACSASGDEIATLTCDDGSSVFLLAITEGWVLGAQARDRQELPDLSALNDTKKKWVKHAHERIGRTGLGMLMRSAREDLRLWLAYTALPLPGGRGSGQSGAPAEVFAERPRRRRN
jgi:hypothetical protein